MLCRGEVVTYLFRRVFRHNRHVRTQALTAQTHCGTAALKDSDRKTRLWFTEIQKIKRRVFVAELFKSQLSTVITADRTRKGLKSTISTEVDKGIIARLSTALTQQNAKPRLNLQKHRRQEKRSASEKYSWVTNLRGPSSYSLMTGAVVTNQ